METPWYDCVCVVRLCSFLPNRPEYNGSAVQLQRRLPPSHTRLWVIVYRMGTIQYYVVRNCRQLVRQTVIGTRPTKDGVVSTTSVVPMTPPGICLPTRLHVRVHASLGSVRDQIRTKRLGRLKEIAIYVGPRPFHKRRMGRARSEKNEFFFCGFSHKIPFNKRKSNSRGTSPSQ